MDIYLSHSRLKGTTTPPSSKSYAQRAIASALLVDGRSTLRNVELCDDTEWALRSIQNLGATITHIDETTIEIIGRLKPLSNNIFVGESGLAARLFTPIASLWESPITISGEGTLLHRPMHTLINPLRECGVEVRDGGGYLPIEVCGKIKGGKICVDGSISSQVISGLLLALPLANEESTLLVEKAVSLPYIDITIDTARQFGVEIYHNDYKEFYIPANQKYQPTDFSIEGDWSAAAALLVGGAIGGEVTIKNLSPLSKQADTQICLALERAGASLIIENNSVTISSRELNAFEFDATNCPDLFPVLAALASAAKGTSTIIGTNRLLHKESNRAETIKEEFEKMGIEIDLETENTMKITGGEIHPASTTSHGDHRIAMAIALAALRCTSGQVTLTDAECVSKSYPDFFEELELLRI